MFGLVLWSDPGDRKAVFWCEDQGDLAYYEAPMADAPDRAFFDAGDMVRFDVTAHEALRLAHNAHLVHGGACQALPDRLKQGATQIPAPESKVIPFRGRMADQAEADPVRRKA
ncbi:MAG: hypothetical protein AAF744_00030 [Pseudomonadota bacterium]